MEGTKQQLIFENLWQKSATPYHEGVRLMWKKNSVNFPEDQVNVRLNELVFAVRAEDGKVVGVSTARKAYISQLKNHLYSFRCFLDQDYRIPGLMSTITLKTRDWLEEIYQTDGSEKDRCIGMITLVENERIMKFRNEAIWSASKMVYIGNSPKGFHIRAYYFKKALI
jgi:hypothetical protein